MGHTLGKWKPQTLGVLGENPPKTPNFGDGDGVTTLKMFEDTLGTEKPQTLGFLGENPQKPRISGMETGELQILGFFGGKIPEKPRISGMGTGFQLSKCSGTLWGRGNLKFRGTFWGKSLKIP